MTRKLRQRQHKTRRAIELLVCYEVRMDARRRVERALGRALKTSEQVHHHSLTKLVACNDVDYHRLLHARAESLGKIHTPLRLLLLDRIDKREKKEEWLTDFYNSGGITKELSDRHRQLWAEGCFKEEALVETGDWK